MKEKYQTLIKMCYLFLTKYGRSLSGGAKLFPFSHGGRTVTHKTMFNVCLLPRRIL